MAARALEEEGGAESARSGMVVARGVRSPPVMVEIELPEGDEARNDACGGRRSEGSAVTRRAGRGGAASTGRGD